MINDKDIEKVLKVNEIKEDFLKKRSNGLVLRDSHIEILKRYNIDYEKHSSLSSLIFEIEEILTYEEAEEDLEKLEEELAEMNYYNYTNK